MESSKGVGLKQEGWRCGKKDPTEVANGQCEFRPVCTPDVGGRKVMPDILRPIALVANPICVWADVEWTLEHEKRFLSTGTRIIQH
jgi:hypothetical protein